MGGPCVWGCFGVVLSSGINLIIVVTGVMTRCQRGYELRDAWYWIRGAWLVNSILLRGAVMRKMRGMRVMSGSRGAPRSRDPSSTDLLSMGVVWHTIGNRYGDRESFHCGDGASENRHGDD